MQQVMVEAISRAQLIKELWNEVEIFARVPFGFGG
jgi:hypothetical protein